MSGVAQCHCPALLPLWSCPGSTDLSPLSCGLGRTRSVRVRLSVQADGHSRAVWGMKLLSPCCCHIPQGHPCEGKRCSRNPAGQNWPLQGIILVFLTSLVPAQVSWASVSALSLLPPHSGLAAGSRTSLPPAPRSV